MTTLEILEAQKLIADLRHVLAVLMGTSDEAKLLDIMREKVPAVFDSFNQLYIRHRSTLMSGPDFDTVATGMGWFMSIAEDPGSLSISGAVKFAHRVDEVLGRIHISATEAGMV